MTFSFVSPPQPRWRVWLFGHVFISVEREPCAFHRMMQRLAFGFRWERLP
jgi:hypothetical protein